MEIFFGQISFFTISKMTKNQFLNWEKKFKTAKNAISRKKIFWIYLISAGGTTSRVAAAGGIFPNSGGVFPNLSSKLKNNTASVMPKLRPMSVKSAPDHPEIVQEKKHKCDKCSAQYQQRSSLKAHMRICGLSKNFKCKLCDNAYAEQRGLDKHFKDIHASHHPCQYCTLAFKTPEALEFHLYRIHKCKNCGKVFSDIMGLKSHVVCEIKGDVNNTDDHGIKNSEDTNMIVQKKKDFYRCHNLKKTMIADGTIALEQEQQIIPDKKSSSSSEIISTTTFPPFKEESIEIKEECFDNDDEDIIISDDNLDDDDYEEEEPNVEEILP